MEIIQTSMEDTPLDIDLICSEIAVLKIMAAKLRVLGKDDLAEHILTDSSHNSLLRGLKVCESLKRMGDCKYIDTFIEENNLPIKCGFSSLTTNDLKYHASKDHPIAIRVQNPPPSGRNLHTVNVVGFDLESGEYLYDEEIPKHQKTMSYFAPENILRIPEKSMYKRVQPLASPFGFFTQHLRLERELDAEFGLEDWRFQNKQKQFRLPENYVFSCFIDGNYF